MPTVHRSTSGLAQFPSRPETPTARVLGVVPMSVRFPPLTAYSSMWLLVPGITPGDEHVQVATVAAQHLVGPRELTRVDGVRPRSVSLPFGASE